MLTKAGIIKVPKTIEKIVLEQVEINPKAPDEFFIRPKPYEDCAESVRQAIEMLRSFCVKHHHDFELVLNQFDDGERKNLRKKYAIARIFGTVAMRIEEIIHKRGAL